MRWLVDLHAHSGYSGGVGRIRLPELARSLTRKGIHCFGTGDCLHPDWLAHLEDNLRETQPGLFQLRRGPEVYFVLQSELVLTAPLVPNGRRRKSVHVVVLFPGISPVRKTIRLLRAFGVRNTIGRPFVKLTGPDDVARFLFALQACDPDILWFPAHIMTPDGVLGPVNPVDSLDAFFGPAAGRIRLVETGLSADPAMLCRIPQLRGLNFISNSDAHSTASHRIGRECTMVELAAPHYSLLRRALTGTGIRLTLEFPPAEGKYYATGHRTGRPGHETGGWVAPHAGANRCPVCGRPVIPGVAERISSLSDGTQATATPPFRTILPLATVLAQATGTRNPASQRIRRWVDTIVTRTDTELACWLMDGQELRERLNDHLPPHLLHALLAVHAGRYAFNPPGHDGAYGRLRIDPE